MANGMIGKWHELHLLVIVARGLLDNIVQAPFEYKYGKKLGINVRHSYYLYRTRAGGHVFGSLSSHMSIATQMHSSLLRNND